MGTVPHYDAATPTWDTPNIATASAVTKAAGVSGPDSRSLIVRGGKVCMRITPAGWESVVYNITPAGWEIVVYDITPAGWRVAERRELREPGPMKYSPPFSQRGHATTRIRRHMLPSNGLVNTRCKYGVSPWARRVSTCHLHFAEK